MPKRQIRRADAIKAAQEGETQQQPDNIVELPTPKEQEEANELKSHTIKLIDGTTVEMKTDLTLEQILRKRLAAKIQAFTLAVRPAIVGYGNTPFLQAFAAEVSANDLLYTKALDVLCHVTLEPLSKFLDNIDADQLAAAMLVALKMITDISKKAEAEKTKKS